MSREEHQRQHDDLVRANCLVERDVRRIRTRKECLERIRYLKQKKSWMVKYDPSSFLSIQFDLVVYSRFMKKYAKSMCLQKRNVSVQSNTEALSTTSSSH